MNASYRKMTSMVMVVAASLVLIVASSSSVKEQQVINWEAIKKAWDNYIEYPSTENAGKLYAALPMENIDISKLDSMGHKVWDEIYDDYSLIAYELLTGDRNAIKVAFRLFNISDGGFSEYINLSLAQLIRVHPKLFLEELELHKKLDFLKNVGYPLFAVNPSFIDRFKARILELELRAKALESVTDKELKSIRDECIKQLREHISKYPKTLLS